MMIKSVLRKVTTLLRLMDFRLASNRFIALATIVLSGIGFGYELYDGGSFGEAVARGAQFGVGVFLAWAIARELDPDHPGSATAATFAGAALLFTGPPRLGASLALLLVFRIVLRSTGRLPTFVDLIFVAGLAVYCARTPDGLPAAMALGVALVVDSRLPEPAPSYTLPLGVVIALGVIAGGAHFGSFSNVWTTPSLLQWVCLALVAVAVISLRVPAPESTNDRRRPLNRTRLVSATWLGVWAGVATVFLMGGAAVPGLSPLWAAVVAVALIRRIPTRTAPRN